MSTAIIGHITIDEIKFEKSGRKYLLCGGPPIYISNALSIFTKPVIVSTVGYDFPRFFMSKIREKSIPCVKIDRRRRTTRFLLVYDENYERKMYLLGKCSKISWSQVANCLTGDVRNIIVSPVIGEMSYKTVAEIKANLDVNISLDAQGFVRKVNSYSKVISVRSRTLEKLIPMIDLLKISLDEIKGAPEGNPIPFLKMCFRRNSSIKVLLTLGRKGCLLASRDTLIYAKPPENIEIVDPTGAGDILLGVYSYLTILKGFDDEEAIALAVAFASFSIGYVGPFTNYSLSHIDKLREETTIETIPSMESIIGGIL